MRAVWARSRDQIGAQSEWKANGAQDISASQQGKRRADGSEPSSPARSLFLLRRAALTAPDIAWDPADGAPSAALQLTFAGSEGSVEMGAELADLGWAQWARTRAERAPSVIDGFACAPAGA